MLNLNPGAEDRKRENGNEEKERIPVSKRFVITRRVVNDKRVVMPKESDSKEEKQEEDKKPCELRKPIFKAVLYLVVFSDEEGAPKGD